MLNNKAVLAVIPARGGSKRIPNKNARLFAGKPLITHAIEQAKQNPIIGRVIVDTDSEEIAAIAKKNGADVPFLRPSELATDTSQLADSTLCLIERLEKEEKYSPEYLMILQPTSPLREQEDINRVWDLMQKGDATTVLTVCSTHPRLYYLDEKQNITLVNGSERQSTNTQDWRDAYVLNGCFVYLIKTDVFKAEKSIITKNTKAVICDKWRSVDLDTPEEWVLAEFLFKQKEDIARAINDFS